MHIWLKNLVKVAAAGATIVAIGAGVLMLEEPTKPMVKEADADILALDFAPKTKTEKFADAMVELGMEEPRAYDWNGNKVFFTTTTTTETPVQVLRRYQDKFVEKGINEREWNRSLAKSKLPAQPWEWKNMPQHKREKAAELLKERYERGSEFFSGGVVPIQISEHYVAMAGMESLGEAEDGLDFLDEVLRNGGFESTSKRVKSMRWVEAMREGDRTRVSAMWSDDELDMRKFEQPLHAGEVSPSSKIPVCVGCVRKMRFAGESAGEDQYAANTFVGRLSADEAVHFYKRAMANRGWKLAETSRMFEFAEVRGIKPRSGARFLSFARGKEFVTVLIHPGRDGKTVVQVFESP